VPDIPDRILGFTVHLAEKMGYRVLLDCVRERMPSRLVNDSAKWIFVDRGLTRLAQARQIATVLKEDPTVDTSLWPKQERDLLGIVAR
jgi:hypothetical protein